MSNATILLLNPVISVATIIAYDSLRTIINNRKADREHEAIHHLLDMIEEPDWDTEFKNLDKK
jgi:hypothetical protein